MFLLLFIHTFLHKNIDFCSIWYILLLPNIQILMFWAITDFQKPQIMLRIYTSIAK